MIRGHEVSGPAHVVGSSLVQPTQDAITMDMEEDIQCPWVVHKRSSGPLRYTQMDI